MEMRASRQRENWMPRNPTTRKRQKPNSGQQASTTDQQPTREHQQPTREHQQPTREHQQPTRERQQPTREDQQAASTNGTKFGIVTLRDGIDDTWNTNQFALVSREKCRTNEWTNFIVWNTRRSDVRILIVEKCVLNVSRKVSDRHRDALRRGLTLVQVHR